VAVVVVVVVVVVVFLLGILAPGIAYLAIRAAQVLVVDL